MDGNHDDAEALARADARTLVAAVRGARRELRPALVIYAPAPPPRERRRTPASAGVGSFRDGQSSAVVLDSDETGRLVQALRRRSSKSASASSSPTGGRSGRSGSRTHGDPFGRTHLIAFAEDNPWRVFALPATATGATLRVPADQVALAITPR